MIEKKIMEKDLNSQRKYEKLTKLGRRKTKNSVHHKESTVHNPYIAKELS
jgi:hypothetical protein